MKLIRKTSISLSDDEVAIADAIARRLNCSRSEVVRHLLLYHGLCGGDCPLTSKILRLAEPQRSDVIADIRRRAERDDPLRPQSFRQWVKDCLGEVTPASLEKGTESILRKLLDDIKPKPEEAGSGMEAA